MKNLMIKLLKQKKRSVVAAHIIRFLVNHPIKDVCDAFFKRASQGGIDPIFNDEALLALIRIRQTSHCL
jgi:hypothetical protein